jgi:(p)ppGpp synthase/HD superfamily hydrolase
MAIFSGRLERAIAVAHRAHQAEVRKGDGVLPYIVHPVTVAMILARFTTDEDTVIAGLLHDTLEDGSLTEEAIERDFGPRVLATVRDVTEPRIPGLSWETRKARYLRHLQEAPRPALLVAGADKIANLISIIAAQSVQGDAAWERAEAPAERKLAFYRDVHEVIRGAWAGCPLLQELRNRLDEAARKVAR